MPFPPDSLERTRKVVLLGNTPAVCLTETLAPDEDASLLLLGCGDIRNVLFTAYAGMGSDDRTLDYTCCDYNFPVIARNIIAYTLILDDEDGKHFASNFKIYYHMFLPVEDIECLERQARKLVDLATTIDTWHKGTYGKVLRFCNTDTFRRVVDLWETLAYSKSDPFLLRTNPSRSKTWELSQYMKTLAGSEGYLNGFFAHMPVLKSPATLLQRLAQESREFWAKGGADSEPTVDTANPLFLFYSLDGIFYYLHYGTQPHYGFYQAVLDDSLSDNSPLKPQGRTVQGACFHQFRTWSHSFRQSKDRIVLRFVSAEAVAFCNVLLHHRTRDGSTKGNWYCTDNCYEPLILHVNDYRTGGPAPTSFEVIDASSLLDHLGCLNILAATAPLIARRPSAAIRTEMVKPREATCYESNVRLLCGHLSTMALLFGLQLTNYWSDAVATWHPCPKLPRERVYHVYLWRPVEVSEVVFDPTSLAKFLFLVSREMFRDEWSVQTKRGPNRRALQTYVGQRRVHTRASLCAILRVIKGLSIVHWGTFIKLFDEMFKADAALTYQGRAHRPSYEVHLQLFGLLDMPPPASTVHLFRKWRDLPSIVCLTVVVPVWPTNNTAPFIHRHVCIYVRRPPEEEGCVFPDITFQTNTTAKPFGTPFTNHYSVTGVKEIGSHMVSAMVPSALLQTAAGNGEVEVSLRRHYGTDQILYKSAIGKEHVFVSRFQPNMRGHISTDWTLIDETDHGSVGSDTIKSLGGCDTMNSAILTHITPLFDTYCSRIIALRIDIEVVWRELQKQLQGGSVVQFKLWSPFELQVDLGVDPSSGLSVSRLIHLPFPVAATARGHVLYRKVPGSSEDTPDLPFHYWETTKEAWDELWRNAPAWLFYEEDEYDDVKAREWFTRKLDPSYPGSYGEQYLTAPEPKALLSYLAPLAKLGSLTGQFNQAFSWRFSPYNTHLQNLHYLTPDVLPVLKRQSKNNNIWALYLVEMIHTLSNLDSTNKKTDKTECLKILIEEVDPTLPKKSDRLVNVAWRLLAKSLFYNHDGATAEVVFQRNLAGMYLRFMEFRDYPAHRVFELKSWWPGSTEITLIIHSIRMDLSNKTVFLDAAAIPSLPEEGLDVNDPSLEEKKIKLDDDALALWKQFLPAFAERCRTWKHNEEFCEFLYEEMAPLSTKVEEKFMCDCGLGVFPEGYFEDMPQYAYLAPHAIRVAIPVCHKLAPGLQATHVPGSTLGLWPVPKPGYTPFVEKVEEIEWPAPKPRCLRCGLLAENLKCVHCLRAYYCSVECRKKHWNEGHQRICEFVQRTRPFLLYRRTKTDAVVWMKGCVRVLKRRNGDYCYY